MKRPDYAAEPVCVDRLFTQVATRTAWLAGQPTAFVLAATLILAWIGSGPWFGWSDTWQLVVNTATTIATFLMVFLIQNSQNRDAAALQAKLDEVIRARGDRNQATRAISTPAAAAGPIASRNAGRVEGERIATRIITRMNITPLANRIPATKGPCSPALRRCDRAAVTAVDE